MKKAFSLILVMILLFSAIPMTAGAVIVGSDSDAAIPQSEDDDLAVTGADADDLADTAFDPYYNGDLHGTVGSCLWRYDYWGKQLFVYTEPGTAGAIPDYDSPYDEGIAPAWMKLRELKDNLESIWIGYGVTSIGDWAFYELSKVTTVHFSSSPTRIGQYAFSKCYSLKSIAIPDSVTSISLGAFDGCTNLTKVTLPSGLTWLEESAFDNCEKLTHISIPASLKKICTNTFIYCTRLQSVDFQVSPETGESALRSIGKYAFSFCRKVESVDLSATSLDSIDEYAFYNCEGLKTVYLPKTIKSIGDYGLGYHYDSDINQKVILPGFSITGFKGTAAETYANENNIPFHPYEEIKTVDIAAGVTEPVAGETPTYSAVIPATTVYQIADYDGEGYQNGVKWINVSDHKILSQDDVFEFGKTYSVYIAMATQGYYVFPDTVSGTINGNAAVISEQSSRRSVMSYSFKVETTKVGYLSVFNVIEPVAGESPSYTASVLENCGYRIKDTTSGGTKNGIVWRNLTDNVGMKPDNSKFEGGKKYRIEILIVPESDAYQFVSDQLTGTINGHNATVVRNHLDSNTIYMDCTFTCDPNRIQSAVVNDVVEPASGAKPSYSASAPANRGYRIKSVNNDMTKNGVRWYNVTDNKDVLPDTGRFEPGKEYYVEIILEPVSGDYAFVDELYVGINGEFADLYRYDDGSIGVWEIYTLPNVIEYAECTVKVPVTGNKPDMDPKSGDSTYYGVGLKGWYLNQGGSLTALSSTDTFVKGKQYTVRVFFSTVSHNVTFDSSTTFLINGAAANRYDSTGNYYEMTYTCQDQIVISEVSINGTPDIPVAGTSAKDNPPTGTGGETFYDVTMRQWYQLGSSASFTGDFEEGKTYYPSYSMMLKDSTLYRFADEVYVTFDDGTVKQANRRSAGLIRVTGNNVKAVANASAGILGDADTDGEVTIFDATAIQRYLADLPVPNFSEKAADADEDGGVTIFDATAIQRYLADLPSNPNIGKPIV